MITTPPLSGKPQAGQGSVVPDGVPGSAVTPPGHVSVYVDDWRLLQDSITEKGNFGK